MIKYDRMLVSTISDVTHYERRHRLFGFLHMTTCVLSFNLIMTKLSSSRHLCKYPTGDRCVGKSRGTTLIGTVGVVNHEL